METPHSLGIIGNPLEHTRSPHLHNRMIKRLALPYVYLRIPIVAKQLRHLRRFIRIMDITGLNVTTPHKQAVLKHMDVLDESAAGCGSVNTIVARGDTLHGYDTDGAGCLAALAQRWRMPLKQMHVTIIGAGGAARAIAHSVAAAQPRSLTILNRTRTSARSLARTCNTIYMGSVCGAELSADNLRAATQQSQLIIQASAAPLNGPNRLRWPARCAHQRLRIMDIRYGSANPWLTQAARAGASVSDGREMLIQQAALSFQLWTGKSADLSYWRRIVGR